MWTAAEAVCIFVSRRKKKKNNVCVSKLEKKENFIKMAKNHCALCL